MHSYLPLIPLTLEFPNTWHHWRQNWTQNLNCYKEGLRGRECLWTSVQNCSWMLRHFKGKPLHCLADTITHIVCIGNEHVCMYTYTYMYIGPTHPSILGMMMMIITPLSHEMTHWTPHTREYHTLRTTNNQLLCHHSFFFFFKKIRLDWKAPLRIKNGDFTDSPHYSQQRRPGTW